VGRGLQAGCRELWVGEDGHRAYRQKITGRVRATEGRGCDRGLREGCGACRQGLLAVSCRGKRGGSGRTGSMQGAIGRGVGRVQEAVGMGLQAGDYGRLLGTGCRGLQGGFMGLQAACRGLWASGWGQGAAGRGLQVVAAVCRYVAVGSELQAEGLWQGAAGRHLQ